MTRNRNIGRISSRQLGKAALLAAVGALMVAGSGSVASAQSTLFWDASHKLTATGGGGAGTWDLTSLNWYPGTGTADVAWNSDTTGATDTATFAGTAGAVTLGSPISVGKLVFSTTAYTMAGTATNKLTFGSAAPEIDLGTGVAMTTITAPISLGTASTFFINQTSGAVAADTIALNAASTYNGVTFNVNQAKVTMANAEFTGSGLDTKTGTGWLSMTVANTNSGGWLVTGGVLTQGGGSNTFGTGAITVNGDGGANWATAGELCVSNGSSANAVTLAGGIISGDNGTSTYSGTITASTGSGFTTSSIRLGDFYENTSRNMNFTGSLAGAGNLQIINAGQTGTAAASGQILTLSGNNSGFTGTLTVDPDHIVQFNNTGSFLSGGTLAATNVSPGGLNESVASVTGLPIVAMGFIGSAPTIDDLTTLGGVLAIGNSLNWNTSLNMANVAGGKWFLGATTGTTATFSSTLSADTDNIYRLGGGNGTLLVTSQLTDNGGTGAIIGDSHIGGGGTVVFTQNESYTGMTTINGGTLQLGNGGTTGNVAGAITINSPGVLAYDHSDNLNITNSLSGNGSISNIGTGSITFNAANTLSLTVSGTQVIGVNGSFNAPTLTLAGGTLSIAGSTASSAFATTVVNPGASSITGGFATSAQSLALGTLTHNSGGTLNIIPLTTGKVTTGAANTNGILGGWFTYNTNDWAANDGSGNVVAYTGYTPDVWATGNNTDVTTSDTPASASTTNSLRFNSITAANTLTLAGTNTVTSGGILETANAGANAVTITGGTIQAGGTNDLVVIQNNMAAPMTISSIIAGSHGLTKSGAGTVALTGTVANTFTGNVFIDGGTLSYTADNQLGTSTTANTINLNNGGTLSYVPLSNVNLSRGISFGIGGGGINIASSGNGGANGANNGPNGAKVTLNTAGQLSGPGAITSSGVGILTISTAQANYNGAGWIINGGTILNTSNVAVPLGQVEVGIAGGLGGNSVPVTINADGELATKVAVANPITLNGGVVGSDGASGAYSSAINVTANSSIRVGNFFSTGGQSPIFSGPLSGSGNINLLNGQSYDANMAPVPVAVGDGHFLTLSGNNSAYTGTITVNAGQGILLSNANSVPVGNGSTPGLAANATATALPMISLGAPATGDISPPALTDNTGAFGGVLAINGGTATNSPLYGVEINESTLYNGNWFLGTQNGSIYNGPTITPGNGNLYRLGGGGGALYLYNSDDLSASGNNNVQIGAAAVNGGGTVVYVQQMSYSGTTSIVNGTLEMGNNDVPGGATNEVDDSMPTGTVLTFGGSNGTSTFNGTLDLQGDMQHLTAAQSLNVAAGADPTKQIITNNLNRGTGPATLTIDTTNGSTTWPGTIQDGSGQVALTIQGNTPGNGMTLTGSNTYSGTTTVGNSQSGVAQTLQIGNGGPTGSISSPVVFGVSGSKLIFNTSNSFTVKGSVSGPGSVIQNGSGVVTVTNNNSFTGGLAVNSGTFASGKAPAGTNTLGSGAVTLNGGKLALQGQQVSSGVLSALGPVSIAPSSFNVDAIYSSTDTGEYPNNSNTAPPAGIQFFDSSAGFYQSGFKVPAQHSNAAPAGTAMTTGGIIGPSFTSEVLNTVTNTNTPFVMQSFTANNDIKAVRGVTQTVTLATPAVFHNMAILGASTDAHAPAINGLGAGDDEAPITINFSDGSSVTTTFNAYDWGGSALDDPARQAADALNAKGDHPAYRFSPISTYTSNPANVGQDTVPYTMYETDIDMSNIKGVDYSNKTVVSMSFTTDPNDTVNALLASDILAVSGQFIPLIDSPTQAYGNNVNVTADSGIDVSVSLTASMGSLTIGSNALSVTSADTTKNAYSLAFSGTTLSGNPTFNVSDSAGGGKGTLILGSTSGTAASITKAGTGVLQLPGTSAIPNVLTINGGVVAIPYTGGSPVNSIAADIAAAYNKGSWNTTNPGGPTITTAAAGKLGTTLGYLDTGTSVDVMYTWDGDLNLDGAVNNSDVTAMNAGNGSSWAQGDLNYDGVKNADDWSLFLLGEASQDGSIPTGVPEPTALGLLAAAGVMGMRRRRRQ